MYEEDVPKYRKKAKKVHPKKSDHIHGEDYCIFEYPRKELSKELGWYFVPAVTIGKYCPLCGKIQSIFTKDTKYTNYSQMFHPDAAVGREWNEDAKKEFNPETRTLPTFKLDDEWSQKYVQLEEKK